MQQGPLTRQDGLIVKSLAEEMLIYDERSNQVHALAPAAARVWRLCDGSRTPEEIAEALGLAPAMVDQALAELEDSGLLEPASLEAALFSRIDRRKLLTRGAALSVPLIVSAALLPATAAASGPASITISETTLGVTTYLTSLGASGNLPLSFAQNGSVSTSGQFLDISMSGTTVNVTFINGDTPVNYTLTNPTTSTGQISPTPNGSNFSFPADQANSLTLTYSA